LTKISKNCWDCILKSVARNGEPACLGSGELPWSYTIQFCSEKYLQKRVKQQNQINAINDLFLVSRTLINL